MADQMGTRKAQPMAVSKAHAKVDPSAQQKAVEMELSSVAVMAVLSAVQMVDSMADRKAALLAV